MTWLLLSQVGLGRLPQWTHVAEATESAEPRLSALLHSSLNFLDLSVVLNSCNLTTVY
jgi:hypothetical protein